MRLRNQYYWTFLFKTFHNCPYPALSWLFKINFQGKQLTASAIFLRCTSARLTILTKDYNNQSRLITTVLPKLVFLVHIASCIHYHLPEKTQRLLLCMACPCLSRHLFRMVCCFSSSLIPLHSNSSLYPSSGRGR